MVPFLESVPPCPPSITRARLLAAFQDVFIGRTLAACLGAFSRPTPWADGMRIALPRFSLAATVRMIDRVHRYPADMGTSSHPPHASGLPNGNIFMISISHLADGRHAS